MVEILRLAVEVIDERELKRAADALAQGRLVIFPTDTVYGLGTNALDVAAVEHVFEVKWRTADKPLPVLVASHEELEEVVVNIPESAEELMRHFWPGALTIVLKKSSRIPEIVTARRDTVAVRMPAHPLTRELIRQAGVPVVAPSANIADATPPARFEDIDKRLLDAVDMAVDAGPSQYGVPSTIVDLTGPAPVLLRQGAISQKSIEEVVGL